VNEVMWAVLLLLALAGFSVSAMFPWEQVMIVGRDVMLGSGAVGIPLELIYFTLLGIALGRPGPRPAGWYWRSFMHHRLLSPRARRFVMPWFYAGALCFVGIGLGILIVLLGFVGALRQG
jgi:hypothetical protein